MISVLLNIVDSRFSILFYQPVLMAGPDRVLGPELGIYRLVGTHRLFFKKIIDRSIDR